MPSDKTDRWRLRMRVASALIAIVGAAVTLAVADAATGPRASTAVTGGVLAWGNNANGEVGIGFASVRPNNPRIPIRTNGLAGGVRQVAAGAMAELFGGFSLALLAEGTVVGWGRNVEGQLGNPGAGGFSTVPVPVVGLTGIRQVATEGTFAMALGDDGRVWVWGDNQTRIAGDPNNTAPVIPTPVLVPGLTDVQQIAATERFAIALRTDGQVLMWGDNMFGESGDPNWFSLGTMITTPRLVPQIAGAVQVAGTFATGYALRGDGTVLGWGAAHYGELGTPAQGFDGHTATPIPGLGNVSQVAAGHFYTPDGEREGRAYAVLGDHTVRSWGYNGFGMALGTFSASPFIAPTAVPGLVDVAQMAVGGQFNVATRLDGSAVVWGGAANAPEARIGSNGFGLYGDGTNISDGGLHIVPGLSHVSQVAASQSHIVALGTDSSPGTVVPDVTGLACGTATTTLSTANLVAACSSTIAGPTVSSQSPASGKEVRVGSTVQLTMIATVPDLVGNVLVGAKSLLTAAGLGLGTVGKKVDTSLCVNVGLVATQNISAGSKVTPGTAVSVTQWVPPKKGCD